MQKIIAGCGYCSRRKAEELILSGRVKVDGIVIDQLGFKADYSSEILVDDIRISKEDQKVVYLLNKPKGVISSAKDDRGRRTVVDLVDCKYRLYPLGRLDFDSSGLILLSNDGQLMQELIHPRYQVEKTYEATISKLLSDEEKERLEKGVVIEDYVSAPCHIEIIRYNENKKKTFLTITIHEGRHREIRKMFETVGARVMRLHRIREANLELGDLKSGEYRLLKPYEVAKLKDFLKGSDL